MPNTDNNKYRLYFTGQRGALSFDRKWALKEIVDQRGKGFSLSDRSTFHGRKMTPWKETLHMPELHWERPIGYTFILEPPTPDPRFGAAGMKSIQIDYGRLSVGWVLVVLLGAGGVVYLKESS